jgi:HEPN domain-containing protein
MKKSKEESQRWFKQGEYDFKAARQNFEQKIYSYACFLAEQSAQKALKSFLIFKGERYVWEHSVQKLAEKCSQYDEEFTKFRASGAVLDKYYLTTRYPDVIAPPAIPYESYTEREALQAIDLAKEILEKVKSELGEG